MRLARTVVLATGLVLWAPGALAGDPRLAPLPREEAKVVHGPFGQGDCDACHERADPKDPGPAPLGKEGCLSCHDEFEGKARVRVGKGKHHPAEDACAKCHNPHNSKKKKLLL